MPPTLAAITQFLPLKHAIDLARALMLGQVPHAPLHVAVLVAYAGVDTMRRSRSRGAVSSSEGPHARRQVAAHHLHGRVVRRAFYLPRLFVYHSMATDAISIERFKLMERRLYRGIMTPSAVLTVVSDLWLAGLRHHRRMDARCSRWSRSPSPSTSGSANSSPTSAADRNTHGDKFYR